MNEQGAFICDYEIFKNMYRLKARDASRSGRAIFIGLITLTDMCGHLPKKELLCIAMEKLLDSIHESLRKSDVISRFSATQYILMLPSHTYENGQMVMERIAKNFHDANPKMLLFLNHQNNKHNFH